MNLANGLPVLVEATIASSVAIAMVLLIRQPLRTRFGATVAYAGWLLVPAALLAVLLPAATVATPVPAVLQLGRVMPNAMAANAPAPIDPATVAMLLWGIGVLLALCRFVMQQHRFRRALGTLQPRRDGMQQAGATHGLPAVFGLLRPRIVVPADFDCRFSAEQQTLMQAHERSHIRAGDLHANAAVVGLRCLFWFNPMVHAASRHFRHDQELACDQRVIARYPQSRRVYGEAMLKAQLAAQSLPLGCHWGYGHPLKERIAMLNQPVPTKARWAVGSAAVTVLTLAVACAAWAAQPPQTSGNRMAGIAGERTPPPRYPEAAAEQGIGGTVVLLVDVGVDGRATDVEVERAEPTGVFDQAAIDAARQWTFQPEIKDGKAVHSRVRVPIRFEPDDLSSSPANSESRLPPPVYPSEAVEKRLSGVVVLVIDVDAEGNPVDVVVESSEPASVFDQAAVDAASKWKFNPRIEDGQPVAGRVRVPVRFEIPPGEAGADRGAGLDVAALADTGQVRSASCNNVVGSPGSDSMVCTGD